MQTPFFVLTGLVLFSLLSVVFISNYDASAAVPLALRATRGSDIGCAYPNCWEGIGLNRPPDLIVSNDWMAVNRCFATDVSEGGFGSPAYDSRIGSLQNKFIQKMRPPDNAQQYYNWTRSIFFYLRQGFEMPEHLKKLPKPVICNLLPKNAEMWGSQLTEYKERIMENERV
ncbi:hypothetical protein KY329_01520 [Candidatus Woesearchaeota archaeon]|nr:hypothetical protein [Candidatus Woesearchaeota archaeon]